MTKTADLFDAYTLRARVQPGVLVILPLVLAVAAWFVPAIKPFGALIGSVAVLAVFGTVLAEVSREAGLEVEALLKKEWGGFPTLLRLRHRGGALPSDERARLHATIVRVVPGVVLPSKQDEELSPVAADKAYEGAVLWLRERTRDVTLFPLVFAENANYGMRRNAYGLRTAGLVCSAIGTAMAVTLMLRLWKAGGSQFAASVIVTVVNAYLFAYWLVRVTPAAVRSAADRYADRLFGAATTLPNVPD